MYCHTLPTAQLFLFICSFTDSSIQLFLQLSPKHLLCAGLWVMLSGYDSKQESCRFCFLDTAPHTLKKLSHYGAEK